MKCPECESEQESASARLRIDGLWAVACDLCGAVWAVLGARKGDESDQRRSAG